MVTQVTLPQTKSLKDIVKEEYTRCAKDPAYFMKKYCIIQHPVRGKIPFRLWDFQEKTLGQFRQNRYNIILKSRQLGISTLVAGYALWLMLFHGDKKVLVIATKQGVAKNLVTKVRVMHSNLPSWLKGKCVADNKLSLEFANGSSILAEAASPEAGRSEALSLLILDEAAFIEYIDTIWAAAAMTLATGGDAIVLSTPNGVGNLFHKMWVSAEEGVGFTGSTGDEEGEGNDGSKEETTSFLFNPIKLHWTVHPERDQKWRDEQDGLLGKRKAAQECDCDFISSGQTVIEGPIIKWYEDTRVKPPVEKRYIDHNLWIWEYPVAGRTYIVTADPARGDGSDSSAIQVLDVDNLVQVAEYKGFIGTKEFGNLCVNVATEYNDSLLVIENQAMGWAVVQQAVEREYKNLFYSSADMLVVDVHNQVKRGYDMRTPDSTTKLIAGITAGPKIRPLLISKVDEYFRSQEIIVYSKRLITELYTFIWKNGRADHLDGYHDDTIIALGYALLVRDTALRLKQQGIDLQKRALDRVNTSPKIYTPNSRIIDPYEMRITSGYSEDLRWLIDAKKEKQVQMTPEEYRKMQEEEEKKKVGTPCPPSIG
jgi:hypothetical protein